MPIGTAHVQLQTLTVLIGKALQLMLMLLVPIGTAHVQLQTLTVLIGRVLLQMLMLQALTGTVFTAGSKVIVLQITVIII